MAPVLAASLLVVAGGGPSGAAVAPSQQSAPVVYAYYANTQALPISGGTIFLTARVRYATLCTIFVSPHITGLPKKLACSSRATKRLRLKVHIPDESKRGGALLDFELSARGKYGLAEASEVAVGVGVAPPPFTFSPHSASFGEAGVGTTSNPKVITLINHTKKTQQVGALQVESQPGTNYQDFTLNPGTCSGAQLTAHESCTFNVVFAPRGSGTRNGRVELQYVVTNSKGAQTTENFTMHLGGLGAFGVASLSSPTLQFGTEGVTVTSNVVPVSLSNIGAVPLVVGGVTITGGNPSDFILSQNDCQGAIPPGQDCSMLLQFAPSEPGARTSTLQISDNERSGMSTVALQGTGAYATTQLSMTSVAFGNLNEGTTKSQPISITNTSGATLRFGSAKFTGVNPQDFGFGAGTCASGGDQLGAGETCSFSVSFSPQAANFRSATLVISDNSAGGAEQISLSGTGVVPPPPPA